MGHAHLNVFAHADSETSWRVRLHNKPALRIGGPACLHSCNLDEAIMRLSDEAAHLSVVVKKAFHSALLV